MLDLELLVAEVNRLSARYQACQSWRGNDPLRVIIDRSAIRRGEAMLARKAVVIDTIVLLGGEYYTGKDVRGPLSMGPLPGEVVRES